MIGCLELHTYSSLTPAFLPQFKHTLAALEEAIVFYDPEALKIKGRTAINPDAILAAFDHPNMIVFDRPEDLHAYLLQKKYHQSVLLMMSSGNYGGLDWSALAQLIERS